ncbi:MAG: 30S ribosomal protein S1 [Desulfobacterales bacterium]
MNDETSFEDDEPEDDEQKNDGEDFGALLDAYGADFDGSVRVGDKINGKIIAIGADTVFVDTGTKIDGIVDKKELLDDQGHLPCDVGDRLELFVVAADEGEIRLSRALSGIGGLQLLTDAFHNRIPVEGRVTETCKGGFRVAVMQRTAFCPISQMDVTYVDSPENYVGETLLFSITQFEDKGRNIVLSRRKLLEREQQKARAAFLTTLTTGAVLTGTVSRLMPYGAFVELIPGLEGMVHISELSWSRLEKPEEAVRPGDRIQVKVIGIETGEDAAREKIALSVKQATADPWADVLDRFQPQDLIQGKVTRCAPFGAFVEIAPGIEGLVHISEMSFVKRVQKPTDIVTPGETVTVMVKAIDSEKRRVSLSIRDTRGDPWAEVSERYPVGRSVTGVVEKKENFGYFITLEPGVTGLLPKSMIGKASDPAAFDKIRAGSPVTVVIDAVDSRNRKVTLRPADVAADENWQKYTRPAPAALSPLGEKLQRALSGKKGK